MPSHHSTHTGGFLSDKQAKLAEKGDFESVKALLAQDARYLKAMTMGHNRTLIWSAARKNRFELVKYLVELGADLNIPGRYRNQTYLLLKPYAIACRYKRFELAEFLLKQGTEIDVFTACYLRKNELVEKLIKQNSEIVNRKQEADSVWEVRPIHYAICGKHFEIARLLIENGAMVAPFSELLLEMALDYDRLDLIKLLLEAGADVSKVSTEEILFNENPETTQLFYKHGFQPKNLDEGYWPPLLYTARGDKGEHPEKIEILLKNGASVNLRGPKGATALHIAAKAGFVKVLKILVKYGADVQSKRNDGLTALEVAIKNKRTGTIDYLQTLEKKG